VLCATNEGFSKALVIKVTVLVTLINDRINPLLIVGFSSQFAAQFMLAGKDLVKAGPKLNK